MITGRLRRRAPFPEIPALTLQNIGWNTRVLDRDDLREFCHLHGLTILYVQLTGPQKHLCFDLGTRKLVMVNCDLSEPEVLYNAWYGCFGLLGHTQTEAHSIGICAAIPHCMLKYRTLKGVPTHLIGQRLWLAEQCGL